MEQNQTPKKMGSTSEHEKLVREILARYGATPYFRLWKNNTGKIKVRERYVNFGLVGSSDILGICCDGKMICVEVKTGSAKTSRHQKNFRRMIECMGGYYFEARHALVLEELCAKFALVDKSKFSTSY